MTVFELNYPRPWTPTVIVEDNKWKELQGLPSQMRRHFEPMLFLRVHQTKVLSPRLVAAKNLALNGTEARDSSSKRSSTTLTSRICPERSFTREKKVMVENLIVRGKMPSKSSKVYTMRTDERRGSIISSNGEIATCAQSAQRPSSVQGLIREGPVSARNGANESPPKPTMATGLVKFGVWELQISQGLSNSEVSARPRRISQLTWYHGRSSAGFSEVGSSGWTSDKLMRNVQAERAARNRKIVNGALPGRWVLSKGTSSKQPTMSTSSSRHAADRSRLRHALLGFSPDQQADSDALFITRQCFPSAPLDSPPSPTSDAASHPFARPPTAPRRPGTGTPRNARPAWAPGTSESPPPDSGGLHRHTPLEPWQDEGEDPAPPEVLPSVILPGGEAAAPGNSNIIIPPFFDVRVKSVRVGPGAGKAADGGGSAGAPH
jgi:hypothetical protein